jgi:solute carrier family 25 iron transporter 28/37
MSNLFFLSPFINVTHISLFLISFVLSLSLLRCFIFLAHAAYFSVYEASKLLLGVDSKDGQHKPLQAATCGALASVSHDLFMNPFDVIKQRMQLGYYRNTFHCIQTILKTEGLRAFYLSFPTTVLSNIPYGCLVVASNESAKKILNPSGHYNITISLLCGTVAGGIASALTTPLDVIKTRLQTADLVPCMELVASTANQQTMNNVSGSCPIAEKRGPPLTGSIPSLNGFSAMKYHTTTERNLLHPSASSSPASGAIGVAQKPKNYFHLLRENYSSIRYIINRIVVEEGYRGFWRGIGPRVINQAPAVALSWTVYESAKNFMGYNLTQQ